MTIKKASHQRTTESSSTNEHQFDTQGQATSNNRSIMSTFWDKFKRSSKGNQSEEYFLTQGAHDGAMTTHSDAKDLCEGSFEENAHKKDKRKKSIENLGAENSSIPLYSRAGWQLFAICYLVGVQSSLTTGFVNSCYSTLEKLFNFNSKFTGLIEGSFHVAIVLLVIPVSFYGRKGNKPLIMAMGAGLIAIGAFCYSSAEFFREQPFSVLNVTHVKKSGAFQDPSGCITNGGATSSEAEREEPAWVKWLFVTGMFLIGVGSTPIQTVAIAYLDQGSKHDENTGWSLGWFHAIGLLAPALGFVLSGSFLSMPIDFSSWAMSTEDDSFMGAWWMGFMLECALALILVPVLLTLPNRGKTMDASKELNTPVRCHSRKQSQNSLKQTFAKQASSTDKTASVVKSEVLSVKDSADNEHAANLTSFAKAPNSPDASSTDPDNSHGGGAYTVKTAHQLQLAEFWLCMKCLMKDKTFLCLLLHGSVLHMTTAGLTAFIPKFFETQYRMIAQIAAFVAGGVSVPAAAIGAIISGYLIKRMQLNCLGTIKMTFYAQGTCIILCALFFIIRCPYGHVYMLDEVDQLKEVSGLNASEGECEQSEMQIHCVNNQFNIFSPCILDCVQEGSCGQQNISINVGLCEPGECYWRVPAFTIFFITFLVASMVAVPRIFALLRLVQDDWKTISLGIQWVFFRLLGMIPGPLVYGQIFDSSCTQWGSFSMTCSSSHSSGHCSFYNSTTLRNYMICVTVGSLVIGELCLFFAIHFYEKEHQGPGKKGYISPPDDHIVQTVFNFDQKIGAVSDTDEKYQRSEEGAEHPISIKMFEKSGSDFQTSIDLDKNREVRLTDGHQNVTTT